MSKKKQKQSTLELLDSLIPILLVCWVLVFAYIAYFIQSSVLAFITVVPVFFIYAAYLLFSAIYPYKEVEILEALEKDTYEAKAKRRMKAPVLSRGKLIAAGISFIGGILLCILL